jgi:tetratricopeptide (TPR) repeat protein
MKSWYLALICCGLLPAYQGAQLNEQPAPIEKLRAEAARQPRSAEAQNALGEALDETGELQAAREAFERATKLNPSFGPGYLNLGMVCLQTGDLPNAESNLNRAIKLLGKTPEAGYAYYLRAKIYTAKNEWQKSLRDLNEAVLLRSDLAEAWSDLGLARKTLQDDKGALTAYEHAVGRDPSDAVAQYRLGAEYLQQDQPHLAVEHLSKAYTLNPKDQSTLNALQTALRRDDKPQEANRIKAELAKLLRERDQTDQNAMAAIKINNEGAALQKNGDLRGALEKYREALRLNPDHNGIRVNYAVALLRLGIWTEGLTELHEASVREPGNALIRAALNDALSQAPPGTVPQWNDNGGPKK